MRMDADVYKTIAQDASAEYRIRGSRFIGAGFRVSSAEETAGHLRQYRKRYHDATHHCYAYRLGGDGGIARFSDDGEPSGTAGRPILSMLEVNGLTNVLLIVVRYFGGEKLGTGGLVRAYTETARAVIADGGVIAVPIMERMKITFPYDHTAGIMNVIARRNLKILDTEYGDDVTVDLGIPPSEAESIRIEFRDITSGNIGFKRS
jgi:uncharacterized YigZ family protein